MTFIPFVEAHIGCTTAGEHLRFKTEELQRNFGVWGYKMINTHQEQGLV